MTKAIGMGLGFLALSVVAGMGPPVASASQSEACRVRGAGGSRCHAGPVAWGLPERNCGGAWYCQSGDR